MAERFRTDPLGHARRREVGRQFFFGAKEAEPVEDAAWIEDFVKILSSSLLTDRSTPHVGFGYRVDDDNWEISVYPIHEGCDNQEAEGSGASPSFAWNIEELRSFSTASTDRAGMQSRSGGTRCPYLWIRGTIRPMRSFSIVARRA
jgi:hypothetical protein